VGVTAVGGKLRMRRDTIFRIASMAKPVTAAAVMMLVEEGKLRLDGPAEQWLAELANRRVLRRLDGPLTDTVPAKRPITVEDLLTFTMGLGLLFDDSLPIQRAIDKNQLFNGPPVPMTPLESDEWILRFGTLPLMHQPGEGRMYNTGSLIQGVLIRRAVKQIHRLERPVELPQSLVGHPLDLANRVCRRDSLSRRRQRQQSNLGVLLSSHAQGDHSRDPCRSPNFVFQQPASSCPHSQASPGRR
jgi:Beta-lactamase